MKSVKYLWIGLVVVAIIAIISLTKHSESTPSFAGVTNYDSLQLDNGNLTLVNGSIAGTSTGTTTLSMKSSSATQGFCLQFNATSTNTLLNMTYAATTSIATQASGVTGVIRYGACN